MTKKKEIGRLIKTMRLSRDMTQAEVAKRIHQSPSSITMYETGRREPDFQTLEALADIFNVPLSTLVDDTEDQRKVSAEQLTAPKTIQARIVSFGMDSLPESEREKILSVLQVMYQNNPDLFKRSENDEPGL